MLPDAFQDVEREMDVQVTQEYDAVTVLWEKMQRSAQVCLLHPNDIKILPSTGQKKRLICVRKLVQDKRMFTCALPLFTRAFRINESRTSL